MKDKAVRELKIKQALVSLEMSIKGYTRARGQEMLELTQDNIEGLKKLLNEDWSDSKDMLTYKDLRSKPVHQQIIEKAKK